MKKTTKIIAIALAMALTGGILFVANAFMGNPVSKMLVRNTAEKYMAQHYMNTDYKIDEVNYSFKTGGYYARIVSPSSADSYFSLAISGTGKFDWDNYEDMVPNGRNTLDRINKEYRGMTKAVFEAEDFPYVSEIAGGVIREKGDIQVGISKDYGIDAETLVLDKVYDVKKLGVKYGDITFYAQDEEVSIKRASEILLDITRILNEKDVPFYAIRFVLEKPRSADGTINEDRRAIYSTDFLYSDIHEDGLTERMEKSHDETMAYFAVQDAKK